MAHNPQAAPGELEHVRGFVNTVDVDGGTETLSEADALRDWLAAHDLLSPDEELSDADLRQAIAVREALRKALLAHNGEPLDPEAVEVLNSAAKSAELVVRFGEEGTGSLAPIRPGLDGALGRLLAIAFGAMADGSWSRLKACPAHDCEWAFYDSSKNRSRTWCSMAVCGNREKARAFRARHRDAQ
jgi:predicted RNA-binding Zn ribbon-like protein